MLIKPQVAEDFNSKFRGQSSPFFNLQELVFGDLLLLKEKGFFNISQLKMTAHNLAVEVQH